MKKTIKTLLFLFVASSLVLVSCKKDDTTATTTVPNGPVITLKDSFATGDYDLKAQNSILNVNVTAQSGTILVTNKIERQVNSAAATTLSSGNVMASQINGFSLSLPVSSLLTGVTLVPGTMVTFTYSVTDSKAQTTKTSITYTAVQNNSIATSNLIELGAQTNTMVEYKFLGIADNFTAYTAGASGTAKANSAKIDFVYYYGATGLNSFAAPANMDGAQVIWGNEIGGWATKNATQFKTTSITKVQFLNYKDNLKTNVLINTVDFSAGAVDKVTGIKQDDVIAFKTASGTQGLIYFSAVAADNAGSTKVYVMY
ncbi:MAG: hypothetical protein EBZ58_11200 [Bacteroidetes bacterium]|nr:hypothetical protein [Bacteroidota bacterium]